MVFMVTCEAKACSKYCLINQLLSSLGYVYRLTNSAWLLSSQRSRGEVVVTLQPHLRSSDGLFVVPLTYPRPLPQPARTWLATHANNEIELRH